MPFLPLVLEHSFHQPPSTIGLVIAVYPVASLLSTPWASWLSRRTHAIIWLHSTAVLLTALATVLFGSSEGLLRWFSVETVMLFVVATRALQGVANALYMASNTAVVTRNFRDHVPYVIGMAEVAVGIGAQFGRLAGGFLYDQGGFAFPFLLVSGVQVAVALVGFNFSEEQDPEDAPDEAAPVAAPAAKKAPRAVAWATLATPRMLAAALATLLNYLLTGFYDGTLPLHLEQNFGAGLSASTIGALYALRSVSYMLTCYLCAQAMAKGTLSFEALIAGGAFCGIAGLVLAGPQLFLTNLLGLSQGSQHLTTAWAVQIASLLVSSAGCAMLLVPSLPLMQSEARRLTRRDDAVEQVTELFMAMLCVGEASGPVLGGWAVGVVGFRAASGLFSSVFLLEVALIACLRLARAAPVETADFGTPGSPLLGLGSPGHSPLLGSPGGSAGRSHSVRWCHASPG